MSPNCEGGSRPESIDSALTRRRRQEDDRPVLRHIPALTDAMVEPQGEGQLIGQELVVATDAVAVLVPDTAFSTPLKPTRIVEEQMVRSTTQICLRCLDHHCLQRDR